MAGIRKILGSAVLALTVVGCGAGATSTALRTIEPSVGGSATAVPLGTSTAGPSAAASPSSGVFVGTLATFLGCPAVKPNGESPWPPGTTKAFEIVLPTGWSSKTNPYRLYRPDGTLAATEGDAIEITGNLPTGSASLCSFGHQIVALDLVAR